MWRIPNTGHDIELRFGATNFEYRYLGTSQWIAISTIEDLKGPEGEPGLSGGREQLTANRNYYIRTDGSDSNNGLTNTSGGAFLTIQKAIDKAEQLDCKGYEPIINVAGGTYIETLILKPLIGAAKITIKGLGATPTDTIIQSSSASDLITANSLGACIYNFENLSIRQTNSTFNSLFNISGDGQINIKNCDLRRNSQGYYFYAQLNGRININGSISISGNADACFAVSTGGIINTFQTPAITITINGNPSFAFSFAFGRIQGLIDSKNTYFYGTATGTQVNFSGYCYARDSGTSGYNYFPGSGTSLINSSYESNA